MGVSAPVSIPTGSMPMSTGYNSSYNYAPPVQAPSPQPQPSQAPQAPQYEVAQSAPQWAQTQNWQTDPTEGLPYSFTQGRAPGSVSANTPEGYAIAGGQDPLKDLEHFKSSIMGGRNWDFDAATIAAGGPAGEDARTLQIPFSQMGGPGDFGSYAGKYGANEEMLRQMFFKEFGI